MISDKRSQANRLDAIVRRTTVNNRFTRDMASKASGLKQISLLGGAIDAKSAEKATKDYEEYFKSEDDSARGRR